MKTETFAILGGGNMGRALIGGLLRRGVRAGEIAVGESSETACAALRNDFGVTTSVDNATAVAKASLVIVAVKPQDVGTALAPLAQTLQRNRAIVLSVAAGIRTASLEQWCGPGVAVVRAMPNRPALVGAGATALFAGKHANEKDRAQAQSAMNAVGDVVWVGSEDELDVVTALSGSGPAYYFLLTEAIAQAAVNLGLEPDAARRLAVGTLYGAGMLAHEGDGDVARLRAEVTSKGGTTEAALRTLETADFRGTMARAMQAATQRSRELATQFGGNP